MDASHLARLSPEIRNHIYSFAFTNPLAVKLQKGTTQHALTKACRQLRRESLAMYYSMTCFNAHLDDGPVTPLVQWLQVLGPELTLTIKTLNVWDIHMLNASLHGEEATQRLLTGNDEDGNSYVLRPVGSLVWSGLYCLVDIKVVLDTMGLGLARVCRLQSPTLSADGATTRLVYTSQFAIVRLESGCRE